MWACRAGIFAVMVAASVAVNGNEPSALQQPTALRAGGAAPERNAMREAARAREPDSVAARRNAATPLQRLIGRVLDEYYVRPMNTRDDSPWSVLHWSIAYGVDAQIAVGGPTGQQVTAIGWLCCNYPTAGQRLIEADGGAWDLAVAPGRQGHDGQFLSMLAQSRVNRNYVLCVGDESRTVESLIEHEKLACRRGQESTFRLVALAHYEGTDAEWRNASGEVWSITRLLKDELAAPIGRYEAACGGLHRLGAISLAVRKREAEGKPFDETYRRAEQRIAAYQRRAFALQNRDGSFSTAWLDKAEQRGDATRVLTTSGHILEWLVVSLPDEQLDDPRVERAAYRIAKILAGASHNDWYPGALGHALHALAVYEQRTTGVEPGMRSERFAQRAEPRSPSDQR